MKRAHALNHGLHILLGRQLYPRATYAWMRKRVIQVHGKGLRSDQSAGDGQHQRDPVAHILAGAPPIDAYSPFGALLFHLHRSTVAINRWDGDHWSCTTNGTKAAPCTGTRATLYMQLNGRALTPQDFAWAECIVRAPGGDLDCGPPPHPINGASLAHAEMGRNKSRRVRRSGVPKVI